MKLQSWVEELRHKGSPDVRIAVAGNKSDLAVQRAVPVVEAQAYADSIDAVFLETSARSAHNVQALFERISESRVLPSSFFLTRAHWGRT